MSLYRPLMGTLAYRVCLALTTGAEALAEDEVAREEGKPTNWVAAMLADAVSAGWLQRKRNDARQLVYSTGVLLSAQSLQHGASPSSEANKPAPAAPAAEPVARSAPAAPSAVGVAPAKVNFAAIVIQRGPAPVRYDTRGPVGRWASLLGGMEAGAWFALPLDNMAGARKAVITQNKAHPDGSRVWEAYRSGSQCIVACTARMTAAA